MKGQDFTATINVNASAAEAFAAITNVHGWWGKTEGITDTISEEWFYQYNKVSYCKFKTLELVPQRKIVWKILDTNDRNEWTGTSMMFEISSMDDKSEIHFTHYGLVPDFECYETCSKGWSFYIGQSLRNLINTGNGNPYLK